MVRRNKIQHSLWFGLQEKYECSSLLNQVFRLQSKCVHIVEKNKKDYNLLRSIPGIGGYAECNFSRVWRFAFNNEGQFSSYVLVLECITVESQKSV
jgi:hypothetical protein